MTNFETSLEYAQSLDQADKLSHFRDQFSIPEDRDGRRNIYVCGNSLGLRPQAAATLVNEVLDDWARLGVEGHFKAAKPWLQYHRLAASGFAMLTGAKENEVVAMNTLTVNLHLMMASFYRPDATRNKIIIESTAFPSDYFAVTSQIRLHGFDPDECLIEWVPRDDELLYSEDLETLLEQHAGEVALLLLPGVQYYTGQVLDMKEHCRLARDAGCKIGLDLAHAIGNVPTELHDWAPDFAAWCTYKYLNSGPGAVGGAFVHSRHLDSDGSEQLMGWWGHEESTRFRMARTFRPAEGAERWQLSNPPILALAPIVASLGLFEEAGISALREKSQLQTEYLKFLFDQHFTGQVDTITPMDARGCQLSLVITDSNLDARAVFKDLEAMHVIGDWREPNVIRVAPVPLYNSFEDIHELIERMKTAIGANEKG
jgi:kynureninase